MDAGPGLSVLTIVKGRTGHLEQLIEGLRRSESAPDELVIVDMSPEKIATLAAPFPIRIIHHPIAGDILPLAKARNLAAASSCFDTLLFLDVDCIPMRGLLSAVTTALAAQDALICAEVRYLAADDSQREWDEQQLLKTAQVHPLRQFPASGLKFEANLGLFWSLAFAMRKDRFNAFGGFDERFCGYGAEDTDFGLRAGALGLRLAFLGGAGVFHQHHEIYDPPLNHWNDIITNSQVFYDLHNKWPMEGWLNSFAAMRLIQIEDGKIIVLRQPTGDEIENARKASNARF